MARRLDRLNPQLNGKGYAFQRIIDRLSQRAESSTSEIDDAINALLGTANTWTTDQRVSGLLRCNSFRIDQAPVAQAIVCTHTITISVNGTNYLIPMKAA